MGDLVSTAKAPPTEGPSSYQEHPMFMRINWQPQPRTRLPHQPQADATGTPFARPHTGHPGHTSSADTQDFRAQADGAP